MLHFLASLLFFALPASAAFPDVPADAHENAEAITYVEARGIVSGYPDGTFKPDLQVNRAEFLKIVVGAVYTDETIAGCIRGTTAVFPDVLADAWFAKYVCTAKVYGIVQGYPDGTFHPERSISFVEAAKILTVALRLNDGLTPGSVWYEHYVRALSQKEAVPISINRFDKPITRGEVAEIVWRANIADHGKASLTYEDIVAIQTDPVAFYISKLGNRDFTMLYGDGQTWYEAPERLGMIGKTAVTDLMEALDSADEYTRTQAFYGLRLAAQHSSVTAFTSGAYPEGSGEAFPPASEHDVLRRAWSEWYDRYAGQWDAGETIVQLYVISTPSESDGNGPIGCGDRAVPITSTLPHTQSVLTAAIDALLSLGSTNVDGHYNALGNAALQIERIDLIGGHATIRLMGEANLAGVCDAPRVQAQIEYTAKQFTTVQTVDIFLNGKPLAEALGGQ